MLRLLKKMYCEHVATPPFSHVSVLKSTLGTTRKSSDKYTNYKLVSISRTFVVEIGHKNIKKSVPRHG